ncbi:MAG: hypothetical protein ABI365_02805, partial [Lysobacteraceae bacterium]
MDRIIASMSFPCIDDIADPWPTSPDMAGRAPSIWPACTFCIVSGSVGVDGAGALTELDCMSMPGIGANGISCM